LAQALLAQIVFALRVCLVPQVPARSNARSILIEG